MSHALLLNGLTRKVSGDAVIAGLGLGAIFSSLETFLAIIISGLMVALLVLRVYNEWRSAKRQDLKDDQYREPPDQ